ncbi:MAG: T9SS type A sorting domain-containing protein [Bacteroides sp.]|nr:T9SS type A sorting domain-containing protein [Bacteroides sp.]
MLDNCSTELESLEWNGEQIFKVEIAGTDNIAAEATRSEQVFDLEGRPVKGSRESLAPGVYIVRSGAESRKFVVR